MGDRVAGGILGPAGRWIGSGTVAGLSDAELVDRYATRGDPAPFEALVERHGPMVWGVCLRGLRDRQAAEDAFQATFLVLIRRARSVRVGNSLAPWLHGVARRVSSRSRSDSARRLAREARHPTPIETLAPPDLPLERRELASLIDDELARSPPRYRDPIILCHLQGLTHDEAAHRLGCPVGTLSIRLSRARARLHDRLQRHNASAITLASLGMPASPTLALISATTRLATGPGPISPAIARLTVGVLRAMFYGGVGKVVTTLVVLGGVTILASLTQASPPLGTHAPATVPLRQEGVIRGRVVDEEGRPIPGAKTWLMASDAISPSTVGSETVADDQGRFSLSIPGKDEAARRSWFWIGVWAIADGRSVGIVTAWGDDQVEAPGELVVPLRRETEPTFLVLDPEGRPVVGARVEPAIVNYFDRRIALSRFPASLLSILGGTTDDRGLTRLSGLHREQLQEVAVDTLSYGRQTFSTYPAASQPENRTLKLRKVGRIEGKIASEDLAQTRGVTLEFTTSGGGFDSKGKARAITDEEGRFAVPAIALGDLYLLEFLDRSLSTRLVPPDGVKITSSQINRLTVPLVPATRVRGLIRSSRTGHPLSRVMLRIDYEVQSPEYGSQIDRVLTGEDGRYETFVLPGQVSLSVTRAAPGTDEVWTPDDIRIDVPDVRSLFDLPPLDLAPPPPPIPGILVGEDDWPYPGVQIEAIRPHRRGFSTATDASGAFSLEDLATTRDAEFKAWPKTLRGSFPAEVVTENPLRLRVRLPRKPR